MQRRQRLARVRTDLVSEGAPRVLVRPQGVGLSAEPVLDVHVEPDEPFTQGVASGLQGQRVQHVLLASQPERALRPRLHRAQPKLFEPPGLLHGEVVRAQLLVRRTDPGAQGRAQHGVRLLDAAGPRQSASDPHGPLAAMDVHVVGVDDQRVTRLLVEESGPRPVGELAGGEELAQAGDVGLQGRVGRCRWCVAPDPRDDRIDRHHAARADQEQGEDCSLAWRSQLQRAAVDAHGQSTQRADRRRSGRFTHIGSGLLARRFHCVIRSFLRGARRACGAPTFPRWAGALLARIGTSCACPCLNAVLQLPVPKALVLQVWPSGRQVRTSPCPEHGPWPPDRCPHGHRTEWEGAYRRRLSRPQGPCKRSAHSPARRGRHSGQWSPKNLLGSAQSVCRKHPRRSHHPF